MSGRVEIASAVLVVTGGVTEAGLKAQVTPVGAAGQLKVTAELNEPSGVTVTAIALVVCPATTLLLRFVGKLKSDCATVTVAADEVTGLS